MTITMQTAWNAFMAGNGVWVPVAGHLAAMPIAEAAPIWLGVQSNAALLVEELKESGDCNFLALRHTAQESRRLRAQVLGASVLSKDFSIPLKVSGMMLRAHFDSIPSKAWQAAVKAQKDLLVYDDHKAALIAEKTLQGDFILLRQGEMIGEVVPTENGHPIGDSIARVLKFRFNEFLSKTPLPEIEIVKGGMAYLQVFPHAIYLGIEAALFNGDKSGVKEFSFWNPDIGDLDTRKVALQLMEWIGIPV